MQLLCNHTNSDRVAWRLRAEVVAAPDLAMQKACEGMVCEFGRKVLSFEGLDL